MRYTVRRTAPHGSQLSTTRLSQIYRIPSQTSSEPREMLVALNGLDDGAGAPPGPPQHPIGAPMRSASPSPDVRGAVFGFIRTLAQLPPPESEGEMVGDGGMSCSTARVHVSTTRATLLPTPFAKPGASVSCGGSAPKPMSNKSAHRCPNSATSSVRSTMICECSRSPPPFKEPGLELATRLGTSSKICTRGPHEGHHTRSSDKETLIERERDSRTARGEWVGGAGARTCTNSS